ncbi:MAG: HAD-IB family phosphatase [Ilumatobacter sp.]|uniref:HAD-IB family phosphatase n=1 Tax=Ilumatobacter sp. TaxID=1967498 RepID=UPI0026259984|nr:HAD-IB family phosphatase [Ilumatobacter sp.]MDJ0770291.1 HAD-IB family phosphatase [Ilumatobacter sp.]
MIAESLAGKRIAITGSTGFVGTALVERLLRGVPECDLILLVRDGRRTPAAKRTEKEIFKNDAFDRLRDQQAEAGGETFEQMTARRVTTVAGDVSADGLGLGEAERATWASADVIIHSAATVSFDSPLDRAVEINLLGPTRIAALCHDLGVTPHLVAVSTCYVAGNRRGNAPEELVSEGPFDIGLSWRAEVDAARRLKGDTEALSRQPERLAEFRKGARSELGAAGAPALAGKTEQLRERWVKDQLVEAGRARAASVGWPDAYAFTKALGEQALTDTKGDVPVSIVRPSIIESAWAEPRPGWIRGFRMAEPVIISYARGLLKEFPGVPEGTVDVIPVDIVVAALIGVAAAGPERAPAITQVASGGINPLKYRAMIDFISGWFTDNPLYDPEGQPILVPEWNFPGRGRVEGQLNRAKSVLSRTERTLQALPLRGRQADFTATLESRRAEVETALQYVELYGLYTECEAIYQVDNLIALWDTLDEADRAAFNFDPRVVDWEHYVTRIHLPSIVQHARVKSTPGKSRSTDRMTRLRRQVLDPRRQVAAFDLENTLIASNVVESYSYLATRRLNGPERMRYVMRTLGQAPGLLRMDSRDRTDFLRHFYRRYEDAPVSQIEEDAREMMTQLIMTKSFPEGLRRVREHQALGHRTVLITGALDFAVAGLKPLFDEIVAAEMSVRPDGTYSGEMSTVPPTGEARAQILADYCDAEGFRLDECVAYADSTSDLPLMEAVGFPVAVNPETRLAAVARKRGWLVENWSKAKGAARPLLPIGPLLSERERRRVFSV